MQITFEVTDDQASKLQTIITHDNSVNGRTYADISEYCHGILTSNLGVETSRIDAEKLAVLLADPVKMAAALAAE